MMDRGNEGSLVMGWNKKEQGGAAAAAAAAAKRHSLPLGCNVLEIRMNLRTSTVKQRPYGGAGLISPKAQPICGVSRPSQTQQRGGKNGKTICPIMVSEDMDDLNNNNNNNNSIDDCGLLFADDRVVFGSIRSMNSGSIILAAGEAGLTATRLNQDEEVGPTGHREQPYTPSDISEHQASEAYLGEVSKKRKLVETDDSYCTNESHQVSNGGHPCKPSTITDTDTDSTTTTTTTNIIVDNNNNNNLIRRAASGPQQSSPPLELVSARGSLRTRQLVQPHKLISLGEHNGKVVCDKHMPWFGIDVGGTLIKVVFFDPKEATREELVTLKRIRRYLKSSKAYGTTGKRDTHLEMPNCVMNKREGSLHFIRFATSQMPDFLALAKNKRLAETIDRVCATGGGAYKFEEEIRTSLGITLNKTDELDSIIYGIHYIDKYNSDRECYYLEDPLDDAKCVKVPYDFSRPYPYMVVNIGSGVSILAVYSATSYSRISGSSIGGGTFLGLCSLLTQCETFDEAIQLAEAGSSAKIDKLVKDIYGGDYPKFNLSGDTVASNFGHMNSAEKRKDVTREDLARALLEMVTINIGSIARMCAANENIDRVVFIGNFLRVNQLSMKLLSYAVDYWSKGAIRALFLEHEGYFGAVGCFVESTQGCH